MNDVLGVRLVVVDTARAPGAPDGVQEP